ncbi:flavodoxin [Ruminococcus sp.]|uniref:flavodoxin n=1 Tax=Ruminococcus sp. TaxID=41978 RepID=UPI00388F68DF
MKRILSIILAVLLIASLAACGNGQKTETTAKSDATTSKADDTATQAEAAQQGAKTSADNDILILYFSADNTKDVDAVSTATPMPNGESSVKWIADIIHDEVGGDIAPIIPSKDYPLEYNALADAAKAEVDNNERPAYEPLSVDPTQYKTVFIGYPIWWYTLPMVLETFFDTYDLSGVTIVPFNTHAGSRDGNTYNMIREREPNANVIDGIAIAGSDAGSDSAKTQVVEWVKKLPLE